MKFVSVRDFRANTAKVRKELKTDGEMVLTANGQPFAVLTSVQPDSLEDELRAMRRARAKLAVERISNEARKQGLADMPMEEIDAIIQESRKQARKEK